MSSRCLAGVSVLTTPPATTVRSVPRFTTIVPGGLQTAAAGSPTLVRVSVTNTAFQTEQRIQQSDSLLSSVFCLLLWGLQSAGAMPTPTAVTSPSECGSPRVAPAEGFAITASTTRWAADASAVAAVTTVTPLCPSAPHMHANVRVWEPRWGGGGP